MLEHDLDRDIARGRQAATLLDSPLFKELYEQEIQTAIMLIRHSKPSAVNDREIAAAHLRALDRLKQLFEGVRDSGRLAELRKAKHDVPQTT